MKPTVELYADGTSGDADMERKMAMLLLEYFQLWKKKHRDYGPGNIAANGAIGVVVRVNDKVQRLKTLLLGEGSPELESMDDTWLDILGYGLIGLAVHRGLWPVFKDELAEVKRCLKGE